MISLHIKYKNGINDILHNTNHNKKTKISLNINDNIINDETVIASAFNDYFSSIAQNLQDKIPNFGNFEDYVTGNPSPNSLFFKAVTQNEMLKTRKTLNHSKSSGDCSIPKQIFECIPNELASILSSLINLTFETGVFPDSLKIVKVIPVFKNNN